MWVDALLKVVQALSTPPASAADMHAYLAGIARSYNIQWTPEYGPRDVSVVSAEFHCLSANALLA
jgi:hypothetical protein